MVSDQEVGIILLAAGSSSRMGHNKLALVIEGQTLLERSIQAALKSRAKYVYVVTGANRKKNESLIKDYDVKTVYNEKWEKGIGSSLKCGLKKMLKKHEKASAVIISVSDQPYLTHEVFNDLIDKYSISEYKIIASEYDNAKGAPVLYDKIFFDDLLSIPNKHGAKQYLIENASKKIITTVPFPDGAVDIDTMEDLKKVSRKG